MNAKSHSDCFPHFSTAAGTDRGPLRSAALPAGSRPGKQAAKERVSRSTPDCPCRANYAGRLTANGAAAGRRPEVRGERGVALVITLVLLSVITVMAVTFLVVSRRERERVGTSTTQNTATFATVAAFEKAKSDILAAMMANSNSYNQGLLVSTNYVSASFNPAAGASLTNVSYNDQNGAPLAGNSLLQSLNNLLYLPRAPVFITSNRFQTTPAELRFYHDLNRNGVYDTNGWAYPFNAAGRIGTNQYYFTGDPEWVGLLDKPEQRHSSSNQFIGRYAYLVLPIGNSLDLNFIHNQAKLIQPPQSDGYFRDQGFGSWEINLAAFLYALNTNSWGVTAVSGYLYRTNAATSSDGPAFQDAAGLLQYRYGGTFNNLRSVKTLYGFPGSGAFVNDYIDGYASGNMLMNSTIPFTRDYDLPTRPWSGADNLTNFTSPEDLFAQTPYAGFTDFTTRLRNAGAQTRSSYDRYTFYRMLAQLGVGSGPESPAQSGVGAAPQATYTKLNLNYNNTAGLSATNFTAWTNGLQFFTNAANLLLTNAGYAFGVSHIPVMLGGTNFAYTPSIHRLLQLAANIYDATTNRAWIGNDTNGGVFPPSVFRPTFTNDIQTNIFITGYVEVTNTSPTTGDFASIPLILPQQARLVTTQTTNIYNVPWVIGAKKGLPNFNEYAMSLVSQVTRKMEITKPAQGAPRSTWHTNLAYLVGISNSIGVEAWNSYSNAFPRQVDVIAIDDATMSLWVTNQPGLPGTLLAGTNLLFTGRYTTPNTGPNVWRGIPASLTANPGLVRASFQIPVLTNYLFVPDSRYRLSPPGLIPVGPNDPFDLTTAYTPVPQFILAVSNRVRFIMRDVVSGRIIDYVQVQGLDSARDLTAELISIDPIGLDVWNTNRQDKASTAGATIGMMNQIQVAAGSKPSSQAQWQNAQLATPNSPTKTDAINQFNSFLNNGVTNLAWQVPFTPTAKFSQYWTWQANDPLVHYTLGDLTSIPLINQPIPVVPPNGPVTNLLVNIGRINDRYQPWGGNPVNHSLTSAKFDYNLTYKDPLVYRSDNWNFPAGRFPNIGWLGRVHRGTPWQTVYLKSAGLTNSGDWQIWSGNPNAFDAGLTQPTNDWRILDVFTVAQNENATRGQLSVNQTNLAAWEAVLGGVLVLTNSRPDGVITNGPPQLDPVVIDPGINSDALLRIVSGINGMRATNIVTPNLAAPVRIQPGTFLSAGQILSVPELSVNSPFLRLTPAQQQSGISDEAYERIPQQIMSLLKLGDARYVIFAYGQSLRPAPGSIVQTAGPFFGICTNYAITGEFATRSVVRVDNRPTPGVPLSNDQPTRLQPSPPDRRPHVVVESYSVLPPD